MTSALSRVSRVSAGAALALAFSASALAAPIYLKIPDVEGETTAAASDKPRIAVLEVQSWSWGETGQKGGNVEYEWKVEEGESAAAKQLKQDSITIKQTTHAAPSGEKGGTEDINIGIGELQEAARANDRLRNAGPVNGPAPGEAEITLKGSTIKENAPARPKYSDVTLKRGTSAAAAGSVSVAAGDVTGDGSAAASGLPTGKRQHKPFVLTKPMDKGSVSLSLASAWPGCRVGARYPELELGGGGTTHVLQDAVITSCGSASSGGDRPTETLSLNYERIK
jgi:type VI protein secretion system component Hcp